MWLFLNDAFLSVVAHRDRPDDLLVRARVEGDIERVFPSAVVECTPQADYLFRAAVPRALVERVLADRVRSLDYPNFKDSVEDRDRARAYHSVWFTMMRLQHREQFGNEEIR